MFIKKIWSNKIIKRWSSSSKRNY